MVDLSESLKEMREGLPKGQRSYRDRFETEVISRVEEQSHRIDGLENTIKTMNGMAQLAVQQMHSLKQENDQLKHQVGLLTTKIQELQALPAPTDGAGTSIGTEAKGE